MFLSKERSFYEGVSVQFSEFLLLTILDLQNGLSKNAQGCSVLFNIVLQLSKKSFTEEYKAYRTSLCNF